MIDKALAGLSPAQNQGQSYYFQLYPLSLTIVGKESSVPAPGTTYRFTIVKGQQKFDETKLPIEANYKNLNGVNLMVMPKCPINFYLPNFTKQRKTQFVFKMFQYEENQEYFIADYIIDIDPYIEEYKSSRTVRFQHKSKFSQDYQLEFQIYLEKSRFALQKVVKDYKVQRSLKSPLRQRKQSGPNMSARKVSPGGKRSLAQQKPERAQTERSEFNNPSEKSQRQQGTEIESNTNKKVDQSQRSFKQEPKNVSSIRDSRDVASIQQIKKQEAPPITTSRSNHLQEVQAEPVGKAEPAVKAEPVVKTEEQPIKKEQKVNKNYSEKNASQTTSKKQVPNIGIKYKPMARGDAPAQVRMTPSQRLAQTGLPDQQSNTAQIASESGATAIVKDNQKQNILLALFLIISVYLMYLAMGPSRKV